MIGHALLAATPPVMRGLFLRTDALMICAGLRASRRKGRGDAAVQPVFRGCDRGDHCPAIRIEKAARVSVGASPLPAGRDL